MNALGIDLGGTKIAAHLFGADWALCDQRQIATPQDYGALCTALAELVGWAEARAGTALPVGIGAAGILNRTSGRVFAANLAAHGHRLPADLTRRVGRPVVYLNDSCALALSEAVFGAGTGFAAVCALVLGTGVGGGFIRAGQLQPGSAGLAGEIGHIALPASVVARHRLPVLACPCGRAGCFETLLSGAGLARLGQHVAQLDLTAPALVAARADLPAARQVWQIWCALAGELIQTLALTLDPDCIVLGGGLSQIPGLADDLALAAQRVQFAGFAAPVIRIAAGGPASGARGAAYAAWQAAHG